MTQPVAQEEPARTPSPPVPATPAPPATTDDPGPGSFRRQAWLLLAAYTLVHVATTAAVAVAKYAGDLSWTRAFAPWDGPYYAAIVEQGYPASIPGTEEEARAAFFPLYPLLVRGVTEVTGASPAAAGVALNLLLGAAAVILVWLAARTALPAGTAFRAALLFVAFPGGAVFSLFLSDPMLVALAAGCLLLLARKQWLAAGLTAAAATATRPNGVGLVVACAVAAFLAIRHERDRRSLVAPALAPLGTLGYWAWLGAHTGVWNAWFVIQDRFWHQSLDFGIEFTYILKNPIELVTSEASYVVVELGFPFLLLVAWCVWKRGARIPAPAAAFCAVLVAQMVLFSRVGPRPRFLLVTFPLLWLVAQGVRGRWLWALVAVFAVAQVVLTWSFSAQHVIP